MPPAGVPGCRTLQIRVLPAFPFSPRSQDHLPDYRDVSKEDVGRQGFNPSLQGNAVMSQHIRYFKLNI